ncbi:Uncharacterised protein [Vibrio cholerae]|nr:Uncharacterised protein [Vibrio cholerae]CSC39972.1 Uncharacterised protein [Vibrio cholerae]
MTLAITVITMGARKGAFFALLITASSLPLAISACSKMAASLANPSPCATTKRHGVKAP